MLQDVFIRTARLLSAGRLLLVFLASAAGTGAAAADPASPGTEAQLELNEAVIVAPADASGPEAKAVEMLVDEVEKRTLVRWDVVSQWPAGAQAVIVVTSRAALASCAAPVAERIAGDEAKGPEGYVLRAVSDQSPPSVVVAGNDARGVVFGVGRLLRELRMTRNSISVPASVAINTAPKCALRGHQLGYRPKVNTYDGWTPPIWEQYIRDLVVFGANAIELMPPRTDDAEDSPHFTLPPIEMTARVSQLADDYGLSVWLWYPAMAKDYSDPATVAASLKECEEVVGSLPRLDAVFVPGGDPGDTAPHLLMPYLEKQAEVLHKKHPHAQTWVSPQGFTQEWMDEFLSILQTQQPAWLSGIVFAPQNRLSLADLRKAVPSQYPIRHYPDITHTFICQYPVQDWDLAYKRTEDREVVNPRPDAYSRIFRWSLPYTIGFLSYSEGVNDDVNKALWSALGWEPDADVFDVLRQYSRYFIGAEFENDYAHALVALEKNWQGPLLTNVGVMTTLSQVQDMERAASPQLLLNWRFQQTVYRANYDAYVRRRLIYETELEERAMDVLRRAEEIGALLAISQAEAILEKALTERVGQDLRERVSDMAEALYQSIRMQLSVPRFRAINAGRGANFDLIDNPVNNRLWLESRFAELKTLPEEKARLEGIQGILEWTDPGPGGFYDELGNPSRNPHLVRNLTSEFDPENRTNPLLGFDRSPPDMRVSWFSDAESRYEGPLKTHYENLDPAAEYKVRAVYAGDKMQAKLRLLADEQIEVHPFVAKEEPIRPVEFDIPKEATADGELTLTWYQEPGGGSAGRGCQVAEVWLIKKGRNP